MSDQGSDFVKLAIALGIAGLILAISCMHNCTAMDDPHLKNVVELSGYHDVRIGSFAFGCGRDDSICKAFDALNIAERPVRGVVGCGLIVKACTVRLEP